MRRAIVITACLACWPDARAGVFKNLGRDVAAGAVEKIQPVLVATLADAQAKATQLTDHAGAIASGLLDDVNAKGKERIDQVDHILEARMLQAQVEVKDITDHALSGVAQLVDDRLTKAKEAIKDTAKEVISDLDKTVQKTLDHADDMLKARLADVGREVNGVIDKADHALAERIAQVDEVVGRRLGNVDVIASKQRIAIEETALRVAVLIGLVVFTVFVLRKLYGRYGKLVSEANGEGKHGSKNGNPADPWGPRGGARTLMFARGLGVPLLGNLMVAALGAGVLLLLYDRLPLGAQAEATQLVRVHRTGFADSLKRFDFARARFHASQLEYLAPEDPTSHGALIAKAELVRNVFERPTLLGTETGIAGLWKQLDETRRIMGPQPDPDLLVIEAMLRWQTGETRHAELRAASLCARALRVRPGAGGFALAPLARAYIETFVDTPYTDEHVGLGRDSYALDDLRAVMDYAATADRSHPLWKRIQLLRWMRTLDGRSSTAYADMVIAHRDAIAARGSPDALKTALTRRTKAAKAVLDAWADFDTDLVGSAELTRNASVLQVFRLNDAQYARAKWFFDHPTKDTLPPLLVATPEAIDKAAKGTAQDKTQGKAQDKGQNKAQDKAKLLRAANADERLEMASPRLVWARRYQLLFDGAVRPLFELQEADRFGAMETAAAQFEQAMVDVGEATAASVPAAPGKLSAVDQASARAAEAAAALGLYVSDPKSQAPRAPLAGKLAPASLKKNAPEVHKQIDEAMQARGIRLL